MTMDLSFQPKMLLFPFVVCQQQNLRMEITSLLLAHAEVFSKEGCTLITPLIINIQAPKLHILTMQRICLETLKSQLFVER